jgi:hypothetical protein
MVTVLGEWLDGMFSNVFILEEGPCSERKGGDVYEIRECFSLVDGVLPLGNFFLQRPGVEPIRVHEQGHIFQDFR